MNQATCDQYGEWMSLAQDGMLNSTQTRLLHTHLASCQPCQTEWEAMTFVSQMFRAAPMIAPMPGFAARFQAKLAFREEQRRRIMIWILLGMGAFALLALALPSLIGVLCFTGRLILPYQIVAYIQGILNWVSMASIALADALWVLVRYAAIRPIGLACLGSVAAVGIVGIIWMRSVLGRRILARG
jgi:predicted anti-sigma-YlaC factor YlaD